MKFKQRKFFFSFSFEFFCKRKSHQIRTKVFPTLMILGQDVIWKKINQKEKKLQKSFF